MKTPLNRIGERKFVQMVLALSAHVCILEDGHVFYGTSLPQKVFCVNIQYALLKTAVKISSKPENGYLLSFFGDTRPGLMAKP